MRLEFSVFNNSLVFTDSFAQSLGTVLVFLWIKCNPVAILQHLLFLFFRHIIRYIDIHATFSQEQFAVTHIVHTIGKSATPGKPEWLQMYINKNWIVKQNWNPIGFQWILRSKGRLAYYKSMSYKNILYAVICNLIKKIITFFHYIFISFAFLCLNSLSGF